ncbi:DUF192 domain-containing protein [Aliidiomarina halalkaliphila]|uniref:DUF192 domain-containing protein n=2 Tax=Aliidiomarina halalkaliphila TaxID=2593535 RepID=A0A552X658_9GAMM|nr:DUF192 domain-containing protein [Aliidiomarina halalkaliphila]
MLALTVIAASLLSACVKAETPATDALFPACLKGAESAVAQPLALELALTANERSRGLMHRESLPETQGMLFVYPDTQYLSFWMYNTRIPLDIAYLNHDFEIMEIQAMAPCTSALSSLCPSYPASQPVMMALEVNQGQFANWGVSVGDRLYNASCESPLEVSELWSFRNESATQTSAQEQGQ